MLRIVVLTSMLVTVLGSGYGNSYGSRMGSFGAGMSGMSSFDSGMGSMSSMGYNRMGFGSMGSRGSMGSFGSMGLFRPIGSMGFQNTYGAGYASGIIPAAVQSRRSMAFIDVPSTYQDAAPLTIDIAPNNQPLNFQMRSQSSPLNLNTMHESQPGSYQATASVDEPHVREHTVNRPIIQKVNEIISPFRSIKQEVQPMQEQVHTLISRGQNTGYASSGMATGMVIKPVMPVMPSMSSMSMSSMPSSMSGMSSMSSSAGGY